LSRTHSSEAIGQRILARVFRIDVDANLEHAADVPLDLLSAVLGVYVVIALDKVSPGTELISVLHVLKRRFHSTRAFLPLVEMGNDYVIEASEIVLHDLLVVAHVGTHGKVSRVLP
ncbi:hypothetical protein PFISCL1PPCAC_4290, partial [Pristionchus fissidentatus]